MRQHRAKTYESSRFSHELRTFTAMDMWRGGLESSVSATTMK